MLSDLLLNCLISSLYLSFGNRIDGVMVIMLASSAVNHGFDYNIDMCCVSGKHAALWRKSKDWLARNQDNVAEWGDMSVRRLCTHARTHALKSVHVFTLPPSLTHSLIHSRTHARTHARYIMAVTFICEENGVHEETTYLPQVTEKLYQQSCIEYTSP
jgi:hypothetical protein